MKKTASGILLILLITGMLCLALNVQRVRAEQQTVIIKEDGSITPIEAPILTSDKITYVLTGNISYPTFNGIVVERSNVIIDGNGYTVQGNSNRMLYDSTIGLNLTITTNATIENTNIEGFYYGIFLDNSSGNTISGNNAIANNEGILLFNSSSNNVISENNATKNNYVGIYLDESSSNIISANNATTNRNVGIWLYYSSDNVLSNNVIDDNGYNFGVLGDFENSIDTSNLADGKPIFYMTNEMNLVINPESYPDIGYLALVNCLNITVQGLTFAHNVQGILLASTNDSTITNNNITNNANGIYLDSSLNNTVKGNDATANDYGLQLIQSLYNTVEGNDATASNAYGIALDSSSNNNIYHNSFDGKFAPASVDSTSTGNVWDSGYTSGGNWWRDYNGTDQFSGTNQRMPGSDGIGDTPYILKAADTDLYPLMGVFNSYTATYYTMPLVSHACSVTVISNSTISDFAAPVWIEHPQVILIMINVTGAEGSTGFCRVSFPTAMMNGTYHVFLNGTEIPFSLLSCSNNTTSYLYFTYHHSTEAITIVPEYLLLQILPLFMFATLLAVIACKKKTEKSCLQKSCSRRLTD